MLSPTSCFFSSGIQKRVHSGLKVLAMMYIMSAQTALNGLLHVHALSEAGGFGETYWMEIKLTGWPHSTTS